MIALMCKLSGLRCQCVPLWVAETLTYIFSYLLHVVLDNVGRLDARWTRARKSQIITCASEDRFDLNAKVIRSEKNLCQVRRQTTQISPKSVFGIIFPASRYLLVLIPGWLYIPLPTHSQGHACTLSPSGH